MEGKVLALVCAVCFGLNPVMVRMDFSRAGRIDAALIIGLAVAIPIYVALLPVFGGLRWEQVTATAVVAYALGGLFGAGIGRRWLYTAIDRLGASSATAIKNAAPLFTTALAILVFGEHVGLPQWAAIASIIAGITLVTWRSGGGVRQLVDVGVVAALGSALSYGVRPLILKFGLTEANLPLTAALVGAISAFAYALALSRPWGFGSVASGRDALVLFIVAGALQAFGFLALTFGLARDAVSIVYPVTSTAPLFTLAFTWALLRGNEQVTWRIALGALAVVAGVVVL